MHVHQSSTQTNAIHFDFFTFACRSTKFLKRTAPLLQPALVISPMNVFWVYTVDVTNESRTSGILISLLNRQASRQSRIEARTRWRKMEVYFRRRATRQVTRAACRRRPILITSVISVRLWRHHWSKTPIHRSPQWIVAAYDWRYKGRTKCNWSIEINGLKKWH